MWWAGRTASGPAGGTARRPGCHDAPRMSLQRIAWLVTTVGFVAGALILLISGYQGYAAVSAAVGASAAINLR